MGCRSLVSFMTLASIHSSHTLCFRFHGSSTPQFQHVARLILMFAVHKHCFRMCAVSRMFHTCVTIDVSPCSCERGWWHCLTSVASLRILWYFLLVVCGSCYLLGFSCGSFGPSSAYNLVAHGPCYLLGFSCGPIGPSFMCNVLLCDRWWRHFWGVIATYSLVYFASCVRALLFAWLQLRFLRTQLRIPLGCTRALLFAWLQLRSYWPKLHVQRPTLRALLVAYLW